jgi:hypothetical protein
LTNLLKAMLCLNHYLLISLTLYMTPTVRELMHIIPHSCWTMNFCELTLAIKLPPHKWRVCGSGGRLLRGVRRGLGIVSQSACWHQGTIMLLDRSIYYHLFHKTFRYVIKIVTFISIHWVIICVDLVWRIYETHPSLPLTSGCDSAEAPDDGMARPYDGGVHWWAILDTPSRVGARYCHVHLPHNPRKL